MTALRARLPRAGCWQARDWPVDPAQGFGGAPFVGGVGGEGAARGSQGRRREEGRISAVKPGKQRKSIIASRCRQTFAQIKELQSWGRPSAMATGPGVRDDRRFEFVQPAGRTAGMSCQPGRAATRSGRKCLPHHDPRMMSAPAPGLPEGRRGCGRPGRGGPGGEDGLAAGDFDQLGNPADAGGDVGSSHSSK